MYFMQSLPEIIYIKKTAAPPPSPWRLNDAPLKNFFQKLFKLMKHEGHGYQIK